MPPEPLPDLTAEDKRRLQRLSMNATRRLDEIAGVLSSYHADTRSANPLSPNEALRRAEEMLTDANQFAMGVREIVRAARTAYRQAEGLRALGRN